MNIIEYAAMLICVGAAAYGLMHLVEWLKSWKATGAYRVGSESPPWGWPLTILGTIAVIAIFIGLFGYVGSAVFLG